ncbi:MAG TPA: S41 family peptidase [Aliidongia sp.]|nr:S41 family peptidase [Aliidongia sp.]
MKLRRLAVSLAALCTVLAGPALAEGYFRYPTLAGDTVLFTAEGDLWSVPLAGGRAARLTTHPAEETNAVASPDGKEVAFSAAYDGPIEVYVMPVAGGRPRRVSFEGNRSVAVGWTPSGEVLYSTQSANGPSDQRVIVAVDPKSLKRHTLPLADANDAAVSLDGKSVYFTRFGLAVSNDNARFYRGGLLSRLWRFGLDGAHEAEPLPVTDKANDRRPMPLGDRVYFLSDRDGPDNLWSMNADGGDRRQLTHYTDFGIRSASLAQGRIVYQLGADLHVYDAITDTDKTLAIDLASDFDQERPHAVKNPLDFYEAAHFAPDGEHVAVTALGHVALMGVGPLRRVEVATRPESRARGAVVSPDGKWVYAFSETGDANEIWRFAADGSPDRKQLTKDAAGFRTDLWPAPDGKSLAHATADGKLFLLDLGSGDNQLIDTATGADLDTVVWSADSKHLAFVRSDSDVERAQLFLYEPATKTKQRLTTDKYESKAPAFTPDGKWLYFLSDRHFESRNHAPWGDRNLGPYFDRRAQIYALALQADERFPFLPKTELTQDDKKDADKKDSDKKDGDKDKKDDKKSEDKKADDKPGHDAGPAIEWNGLADRLYEVPMAPGNFEALETDGKRLYVLDDDGGGEHKVLKTLPIEDKDPKPVDFLGNVRDFTLSGDRKKIFVRRWAPSDKIGDMLILDAGAKAPGDLDPAKVRTDGWTLEVDPREEWREIFADAWRLHRDFFYDAKLHDLDWARVRAKYAPLVERVTDRSELNDVLGQMMAELGALHSQIIPGDLRKAQDGGQPGFLGARLEREAEGYRIAHIFRTDPELPNDRAPLARPGTDAKEGDLVTAVNGRPATDGDDIALLLANQAGQQVLLTLKRGDRQVKTIVTAIDARGESSLRYSDWEEERRAKVLAAGQGKVGYLHLRAMGPEDIATFAREFYAQYDRDALIIDVRRNNGGNIDSWVIEKLLRRAWAFWKPRLGTRHGTNMQQTFRGHLAVLIDERTYSDGETFAAGIKALKLAPLIGRRTAGAGVWLSDNVRFVDRGSARVAEDAQYAIGTGEWLVEGKGVEPDIDVENPPNATFKGGDAQLEAAIKLLQEEMVKEPVKALR